MCTGDAWCGVSVTWLTGYPSADSLHPTHQKVGVCNTHTVRDLTSRTGRHAAIDLTFCYTHCHKLKWLKSSVTRDANINKII